MENRLIVFSANIIALCRDIGNDKLLKPLAEQLLRSGTSASLNYGEARSASSRRDFIHKINIVLKELRETHVNLKIIDHSANIHDRSLLLWSIDECNQLIAIFVKSVNTATANEKREAKREKRKTR
jgi:four helix bundle protein